MYLMLTYRHAVVLRSVHVPDAHILRTRANIAQPEDASWWGVGITVQFGILWL